MEVDPIEIRIGNLFEANHKVLEIKVEHLKSMDTLLPALKPIEITTFRLARLNFTYVGNPETNQGHFQRFINGIHFNLVRKKDGSFLAMINDDIKLKHIIHIHHLQNIYYDLTGDILKRDGASEELKFHVAKTENTGFVPNKKGPGKYRDHH